MGGFIGGNRFGLGIILWALRVASKDSIYGRMGMEMVRTIGEKNLDPDEIILEKDKTGWGWRIYLLEI